MSNRNNSRHKNQALSVRQAILPEILVPQKSQLSERHRLQNQLAKQFTRMEYIKLITHLAQNVRSTALLSSCVQQISTMDQVARLKQSAENLSPEVEAAYQRLIARYLDFMEATGQQLDANLLEELDRIPELMDFLNDLDDRGFLEKLQDVLDHEFTIRFTL